MLRRRSFAYCIALTALCGFIPVAANAEPPGHLPDIPGFVTLHCDLHMHTLFSDGEVWPTIRVAEAERENLDCIALTDHLRYGKGSKQPEVGGDRNRAYEIAADAAAGGQLLVIRGAEITQPMPPGHINALFLDDADIARKDFMQTLAIARDQGAFLVWNHPWWKSPDVKWEQDGLPQWFEIHDELFADGILRGIEIVNGRSYSRQAHRWALEKGLTILGTTDIHRLVSLEYDLASGHRPQTIVFAKERTAAAIRDALFAGRTAVWFEDSLIGAAEFLDPVFHACVRATETRWLERLAVVELDNVCGLDFIVESAADFAVLNATRVFELPADGRKVLTIATGQVLEQFALPVTVLNLHTTPDDSLATELRFTTTGIITDKRKLDELGAK